MLSLLKAPFFFLLFIGCQLQLFGQAGTWKGDLEVQGTTLRIVFHLEEENGAWKGKMDSPDQMQYGLELSKVEINEKSVLLELAIANAKYEGQLSAEDKMEGQWIQGGMQFPLQLKRTQLRAKKQFPQTPKAPFPYLSEEVSYSNPKAGITLAGTLSRPPSTEKLPAIILISGSGAQDRNSTIFGHQPFWVIADHFSRRGYAVLRVDDRGVGQSTGDAQSGTTADFVTDVLSSVDYLRSLQIIDPRSIILMGHSEGGLIAFMAAAKAKKKIGAVVSLAGPAIPMRDLLIQQGQDVLRIQNFGQDCIDANTKLSTALYDMVIKDKKNKLTVKEIADKAMPVFQQIPQEIKDSLGLSKATLAQSCIQLASPWMRYALKIKPVKYIRKIKCPVLALNGGKDIQVAATPNLELILKTLLKKNRIVTCAEIPNVNHLFQNCKSCSIQEYGELEETFAPEVLKAIEEWLRERLKR